MKLILKLMTGVLVTLVIAFFSLVFLIRSNYANSYEDVPREVYRPDQEKTYYSEDIYEKQEEESKDAILFMGLEGSRTDTLMLALMDEESGEMDVISIPRDTYYDKGGYKDPARKKINSVYGYGDGKGKEAGVIKAVKDITGIEVEKYVKIKYKGVEEVIDAMGGVEIEIPFDMNYDDPYARPPLHIHFKKGIQTLNGEESIEFLRWRKNNRGYSNRHSNGDVGRVQRQQEFIKAAIDKAVSFKLPQVIKTGFENAKTNISFEEALEYAGKIAGIQEINTITLPGEARMIDGYSYYILDEKECETIIKELQKDLKN